MCNEGRCIKLASSNNNNNNNNKVGKSSEVAAEYNKHENAIPSKIKHYLIVPRFLIQ
jgi:hypothetical protein